MASNTPRIALALASGSVRGWAHIGLIRAPEGYGIKPDVLAGASVGALVAAAYASRQVDLLKSWVRRLTRLDVWRLLATTFGGGMMRGNRLVGAIGEQIEDSKISREKEPGVFDVMTTSINVMQDRITRSRMVGDPPDMHIRSFFGDFKMMDFHRAEEAIVLGRSSIERFANDIADLNRTFAKL